MESLLGMELYSASLFRRDHTDCRNGQVVGPKNVISAISQSGSFLDGGASHPLQMAAIPLLEPNRVLQDKVRPVIPFDNENRSFQPL